MKSGDAYYDDLSKAFKEKDEFLEKLRDVFTVEVFSIVKSHFSQCEYDERMQKAIALFANDLINTAESVIDKDDHFPEYRLQTEIENITKLMNKMLAAIDEDDFLKELHMATKRVITQFYPQIMALGSYGFLLLERGTKLYTAGFIINIYQKELI